MLLSRVDEGRSVALRPTPEHADGDVGHTLDSLLGEQLLPLRARRPGADEPHLLAVDASGQPVVVEVVGLLDEHAVMQALRHGGRAARMTTEEIAALYEGGAENFTAHLEAFRSTVPTTALLSPSVRSGARLLLVCSEVDPRVDDALEFLLQPGWQVEVLQVRVTQDAAGGRLVDVVPVDRAAPVRSDVEPRPRPRTGTQRSVPAPTQAQPAPASRFPVERPAPVVVPPSFAGAIGTLRVDQTGPHAPVPADESFDDEEFVDPRLVALAARVDAPAVLVWPRSSGEVHEALLRGDGSIELTDGSLWGDVNDAAHVAGGVPVDGWAVWRLGDVHGPTLGEVLHT